MKKFWFILFIFNLFISSAEALVEVIPVSYSFDQSAHNYFDSTNVELIDGNYGVHPYYADLGNGPSDEWVGWYRKNIINVDFTFSNITNIDEVKLGSVSNIGDGVVLPDVYIYASTDSANWNLLDFIEIDHSRDREYVTYLFDDLNISSQYMRVALHSNSDRFIFIDEVDFYKKGEEMVVSVPEPATMSFFIFGSMGLMSFRKRFFN